MARDRVQWRSVVNMIDIFAVNLCCGLLDVTLRILVGGNVSYPRFNAFGTTIKTFHDSIGNIFGLVLSHSCTFSMTYAHFRVIFISADF